MKILFLGPKDCNLFSFLSSSFEVTHTENKINLNDVIGLDYIISFGYKHIIKEDIINKFKNKIINLHISLLPYNRGYHPNFWSFWEDTPKGVTIHHIDKGIDTGNIIMQKKVCFSKKEDTLSKTHDKLMDEIQNLFINNYSVILSENPPSIPQSSRGTFHLEKDLKKHKDLLSEGWVTPISKIQKSKLRKADFPDESLLLYWRNDEITRKNATCQDIVKNDEHKLWLKKTILDPNVTLLIMEDEGVPVGTIRSNKISPSEYELSWTISPDYRRMGYGFKILKLFLKNKPETFIAKIMPSNKASIKMALKNGFKLISQDEGGLLTYKKMRKRTDLEIIDEVEKVRTKNNVNWMDILRLAFTHAPEDARQLMGRVNEHDQHISNLLQELSNNEQ